MTATHLTNIAFIDLAAQQSRLEPKITNAIGRVLEHGKYIMGPEVKDFEKALCQFSNQSHAVSCSNGTDALILALMALNVGPGDVVFCPAFTFAASAEAIACLGATIMFVDVLETTFNMDPSSLELAVKQVSDQKIGKPCVVMAVDLFGQMADYQSLRTIADRNGMKIVSDAAQSFGARRDGVQVGEFAEIVTTSFFPAKPLGCYGDGGAVLTNDDELADVLRSLRVHGQGTHKYENIRVGLNARLDTIQAAVLLEKIAVFEEEIERRMVVARKYQERLDPAIRTPLLSENDVSTWAQYTVKLDDRERVQARLKEAGIPTAVYYPLPLHKQIAYADCPRVGNGPFCSEKLSTLALSLPMHPYMDDEVHDYICSKMNEAVS